MFQQKIILLTIGLVFFFSGCGQVAPDVDSINKGKNNISNATQIAPQTVSIDENSYGSETTQGSSTSGSYNSSSSGFQSIYFAFGEYSVDENKMQANSEAAQSTQSKIKLEGNCDEFGTDEYNYALGLKRAQAVKESMLSQGVDASRIYIVSFGESNPVCTVSSDACYLQNRRVDFHLVK